MVSHTPPPKPSGIDSPNPHNQSGTAIRSREIRKRVEFLLSIGFTENFIDILQEEIPTLYDKKYIYIKISELQSLGFIHPVKMIMSSPSILRYDLKSMREKMGGLRELGFNDPVKLTASLPAILGYSTEKVGEKIEELKKIGFTNPLKMIISLPIILTYDVENIRGKIEELKKFGFENPIKMITSSPTILSQNGESVCQKVEDVRGLGFMDPVKSITLLPQIIGLHFQKNIRPKYNIFSYFIRKYNLVFSSVELMESNALFFTSKRDKLWVLIRILSEKKWIDINNIHKVSRLLSQNIEQVIMTHLSYPNIASIAELIARSRHLKKSTETTTEQIKLRIREAMQSHPENKVLKRYARGYIK